MNRRAIGDRGELAAREYLSNLGMEILDTNYHSPYGEIDIIARDGASIVFVEVKLRSTNRFGTPAEAVNRRKQQRIIRTALLYLQEKQSDAAVRFDVVEILAGNIRHIPSAFDTTDMSF